MLTFYVLDAIYSVFVHPGIQQKVTDDLGANQSRLGLIVAGFVIICQGPFCEEFFFRGFFYGALRTKLPVLVAAGIDGLLFGLIHFEGARTVS
jgi:CAAX protease family protein